MKSLLTITPVRKFVFQTCGIMISSVIAMEVSAQVLEEITVTAQKREQSLQDVGISVTAFTGDQLRELNFNNTFDLTAQTPGLYIVEFGSGSGTVINIRGSAQNDWADQQEGPVAVYNDGAYNSFSGGVGFAMYDVERVEVLRGPQGTLFGRNATGGVLHVISNKPKQEFEAYGEIQAGEYDKIRFEGAISGALTDTLSGRLAVASDNTAGYMKNSSGPDSQEADGKNLRAQLLFQPNDDFEILLNGRWGKYDNNGQIYHIERAFTDSDFGLGLPGFTNDGFVKAIPDFDTYQSFCGLWLGFVPTNGASQNCHNNTDSDPLKTSNPVNSSVRGKPRSNREQFGFTATVDWQLNDTLKLVSITDYQELEKRFVEAPEVAGAGSVLGAGATLYTDNLFADMTQFSQEFRLHGELDNARWILGLYYLNIDGDFNAGFQSDDIFASSTDNTYTLDTESYAFYVNAEYELSSNWSVLGGLRWTEDEKDIFIDSVCTEVVAGICSLFYGGLLQDNTTFKDSRSEGEWSGHVELDWRPNDDWLVYAKASRGNKAGGFNASGFTFMLPQDVEFDGEILNSYELGFKSALFNGKARLNGSVFFYDYEDFQTFASIGISFVTFNVDSEVVGAEFELITNPWEGWEFLLGVSLMDAEQKDLIYNGIADDRPNPNSPDLSFNGLVRYEWSAFNGTMSAQLDFNHVGERSLNAIDHPALEADSYSVANAKVGYTTADEHWHVDLWVRNLADEEYIANGFDASTFIGSTINIPGSPRWIGGTIRYTY